jgi:hypothetical protein
MNYLFITGCARSGTSALAQLIGNHGNIIMGMERFGHLTSKQNFKLTPEHFTQERFFSMHPEDTFYSSFDEFHSWDPNIRAKFPEAKYIGDKRPGMYDAYDELFQTFQQAHVIFIYRDIYDVASSWNKRAEEGQNWPAHLDFRKAVHAWNQSMKCTLEAIDKGLNVIPVNYEGIFLEEKPIEPLFGKLDLDVDTHVQAKHKNILTNSRMLTEKRKGYLISDEQKRYIDENYSERYKTAMSALTLI